MAVEWKQTALSIASLVRSGISSDQQYYELLRSLDSFIYPVEGLSAADVHQFLCDVSRASPLHTCNSVPQLAHVIFTLLTMQQSNPPQCVVEELFSFFEGCLETAKPRTEVLYLLAHLPTSQDTSTVGTKVISMMANQSEPIDVRRAALHYVLVLCERNSLSLTQLSSALETLSCQILVSIQTPPDSIPVAKLALSQLRTTSNLLEPAGAAAVLPVLSSLLTALKFYMTIGLPGQSNVVSVLAPEAIPSLAKVRREKPTTTIAGPQPPQKQSRIHRSRQGARLQPPSTQASSDSEVSDSDQDLGGRKGLYVKLRSQALSCLATVFSIIGSQTTFSYWLSFLPDGPRLPHSPPSLLSCALRDPSHKCRSAALLVLSSMLEGSRPYLAAADDKHRCGGLSFTPFSSRLGAVLRELHHQLLLCVNTEAHQVVLTRAIRCLALLVTNTPYHQLSSGYLSRVVSTLHSLTQHKDTDVRVACLTCYGAVLSTSAPLAEVEEWLTATQPPWLLQWCHSVLAPPNRHAGLPVKVPVAVQTEAIQVLAAAVKFYFPSLRCHWQLIRELSFTHLATPQQQHSLKLLEELCRAVSDQHTTTALQMWELLLSGPLTPLLQSPSNPSICAQAYAVLSTLGPSTMDQLNLPLRVLALTLPLGLSKDEQASSQVVASAVRVLGVYATFPSLREDVAFLQDNAAAIQQALASRSQPVRVQASWALGNLTDSLFTSSSPSSSFTGWSTRAYSDLLVAAVATLKDSDRVKCNGVRALGNLLRTLPTKVQDCDMRSVCSQLAHCIGSGTMKLRWNACYACHSAFSSAVFTTNHREATSDLLDALCRAVYTCPNFKVRTHAALALGTVQSYTPSQLSQVWEALIHGLEDSEQHSDFSEFRQVANLRVQLCRSLCHILSVVRGEDLANLTSHHLPSQSMAHFTEFVYEAAKEKEDVVVAAVTNMNSWTAGQSSPMLAGMQAVLHSALQQDSST